MAITEREIDQAFADYKSTLGGVREDYFGLIYLQREFGLTHDQAVLQNAFGGHDYGIDAFHIDIERRNLYLLQFKWSPSPSTFKGSYERLISTGMEQLFGNPTQDRLTNALLSQFKSRLLNDMALIDRVLIHFVFNGDIEEAEQSSTNNDRQNPVMPWNLRANDLIQCQFFDKFRDDLSIYYERQQNMFSNMSDSDLGDLEIDQSHKRAVEILRLTKTLLASDGLVDKMSNMREAFENDKIYDQVFDEKRLQVDSRKIILCYKIQLRLNRLVQAILDKGATKYAFMNRARNLLWSLLCQAVLNDQDLEWYREQYGTRLVVEANFTEWLAQLSTTRARILVGDVVKTDPYASHVKEENYGFLRTQAVFKKSMESAHDRWGWVLCKLR